MATRLRWCRSLGSPESLSPPRTNRPSCSIWETCLFSSGPSTPLPLSAPELFKSSRRRCTPFVPPSTPTPHCCRPPSAPFPFRPTEWRQQSPKERPRLCQGKAGPGWLSLSLWLQLRSQGPLMTFVSSQWWSQGQCFQGLDGKLSPERPRRD